MHLHPLGRRGPSSAPLKIQYQARPPRGDPFRSNCEKPADNLHEPEPEPEPEEKNHELVDKFYKRLRDAAAEMGVRETPNMFIKEKKQISTYMKNRLLPLALWI
ncbi:hypothetical protein BS78_01G387600 [Paspalum vaginatum]|nr:hypothetical protein BS78_01G387600 [Paspalum vaginatum]